MSTEWKGVSRMAGAQRIRSGLHARMNTRREGGRARASMELPSRRAARGMQRHTKGGAEDKKELVANAVAMQPHVSDQIGFGGQKYGKVSPEPNTSKRTDNTSLSLCVSSPALLLNHMAERYTSLSRILMEFVDNALDDAECFYIAAPSELGGSTIGGYSREIRINVAIDTRAGSIHVTDNCSGMSSETIKRVVCRVGESKKRGNSFCNGQFGFGMQSFRAAAENLTVLSRSDDGGVINAISVCRQHADGFEVRELVAGLDNEYEYSILKTDISTGTEIIISGIDDQWREGLSAQSVASEIEEHFERILARENLCVCVYEIESKEHRDDSRFENTNNAPDWHRNFFASSQMFNLRARHFVRCLPYDYDNDNIEPISKVEQSFVWPHDDLLQSKRQKNSIGQQVFNVCLVVAGKDVNGRRPRFFVNGRRISEIAKTSSFSAISSNRWSVWENPQVIGYIDINGSSVDGALQPVITRDEFKKTRGRREAYKAIQDMCEATLAHALVTINDLRTDRRLGSLELMLNDCLTSVTRVYGNETKKLSRSAKEECTNSKKAGTETKAPPTKLKTFETGIPERANERKPKKGEIAFEIRLTSHQIWDFQCSEGEPPRSKLKGNTIWVDVSHRDFQNRLKRNRLGKEQFDDRLLSYLATLVSAHYRELAYQQLGTTPESCNEIFCDMIDIYVRLEEHLRNNLPALLKQLEKEQQFPVGTSNATSTPASVANISPFLRRRWRGSR